MKTPKEIAKWAVAGDFPFGPSETLGIAKVTEWIEELIEAEREACAQICDRIADEEGNTPAAYDVPPRNCAIEIRARSKQ